jgi:hypothetical protein
MTTGTVVAAKDCLLQGEIDTYVVSYLKHLRTLSYAKRTLCGKRTIIVSFAEWTKRQQVPVKELHFNPRVERADRTRLPAGTR